MTTKNKTALVPVPSPSLPSTAKGEALTLPVIITNAGKKTTKRFLEFFTANIRNANTRAAYVRAINQFMIWCDVQGVTLETIEPMIVAAYIEQLTAVRNAQTVKQHLAAIRMLFDWMVTGQTMPFNPAASVRGPKYSYKKGKTPVLPVDEMRQFLERIDTSSLLGLRDRALIGLMVYSFARVSAAVGMNVEDYYAIGKRHFIGLNEKGGKYHVVPVHHKSEDFLDAYIDAAGIAGQKNVPLFQSAGGRGRELNGKAMSRVDAWAMVKKRALEAGITAKISPHSFRATGITAYLENGGTIEHAQQIAAHESPRTTKLYDHTNDQITLDEIERIGI
jgi:integrase/recombinase XerD